MIDWSYIYINIYIPTSLIIWIYPHPWWHGYIHIIDSMDVFPLLITWIHPHYQSHRYMYCILILFTLLMAWTYPHYWSHGYFHIIDRMGTYYPHYRWHGYIHIIDCMDNTYIPHYWWHRSIHIIDHNMSALPIAWIFIITHIIDGTDVSTSLITWIISALPITWTYYPHYLMAFNRMQPIDGIWVSNQLSRS